MNQAATLLALIALPLAAIAETFVGVTSATNRFVVATNEAVVIHKFVPATSSPSPEFQVVKDGSVYNLRVPASNEWDFTPTPSSPVAIAGPCELILTASSLINFRRLTGTGIQTLILPQSSPAVTNSVTVNSGQTLRVFRHIQCDAYLPVIVRRGSSSISFNLRGVGGNDEFTGPLELSFIGPSGGTEAFLVSYVLTEEAQIAPQGVALQSPTGAFSIAVEKSTNLTNWTPSVFQDLSHEQKSFYRLRITK